MINKTNAADIKPIISEIKKSENFLEIIEESKQLLVKEHPAKFDYGICEECGNEGIAENVDGELICRQCMEKI